MAPSFEVRALPLPEVSARDAELAAHLAEWMASAVAAARCAPLEPYAADVLAEDAKWPGSLVLLAEEEVGEPVGLLIASSDRVDRPECPRATVVWVAVRPDRRRRGIATRLVAGLLAELGDAHVDGLVVPSDPTAHGFWLAQGWQEGRTTRSGDQVWMERPRLQALSEASRPRPAACLRRPVH